MRTLHFRQTRALAYCGLAPVAALSLLVLFPAYGKGPEWEWNGVPRVVAVGDVHGSLDKLTTTLRAAGLIDDASRWKGGKDHLVFCGDLVDREPDDRKVLDLVQALQEDASRAGGRVHALVGNHEVLTLARDLRYVHPDSYAAFAPDEETSARRKAWDGFKKAMSKPGLDEAALRDAFEKRCVPGYFARLKAFGKSGKYGSFLLQLPAMIKVNGVVFVHGGLTPETAALGLDGINRQVSGGLRTVVESIETLDPVLGFPGSYSESLGAAKMLRGLAGAPGQSIPPSAFAAADALLQQVQGLAFTPDGPLWYRGNSLENENLEREPFGRALKLLGASAVVVGHTITRAGVITSRFHNRLFRADVGMAYGGKPEALVLRASEAKVLDPAAASLTSPAAEPPQGEGWNLPYEHVPDAQVEKFLAEAEIVSKRELRTGTRPVQVLELKSGRMHMRAVFKDTRERTTVAGSSLSRYEHEMAAYWLDRRLGLGMVPPVIARNIAGREGSLSALTESAVDVVAIRSYMDLEQVERDEALRRLAERYSLDLKELMGQAERVRTFDSLIGNLAREDEDRLWIPRDRKVALIDHDAAFAVNTDILPAYLCEYLDPDFRLALQSLRIEDLRAGLSKYLSEGQITAVLTRRDRILQRCGTAAAEGAPEPRSRMRLSGQPLPLPALMQRH